MNGFKSLKIGVVTGLSFILASAALAGPRDTAWKIYNRIASVPPTPTVLRQATQFVQENRPIEVARLAMQNEAFYSVTLKNWIKPWSNRQQTPRVPLNDFVATAVGMIRDDLPFDRVLYDDIIYVASNSTENSNIDDYSPSNNRHYEDLEEDYFWSRRIQKRVQSVLNGISDTAGVLTTRAAGAAFYSAGTNRRVTRFTFINFLCRDFEAMHDVTTPDYRVRRDVERDPGGDTRTYKNKCAGCHAGQDGLGGAFAYFDYDDGQLIETPGLVQNKINKNVLFKAGHETTDDSWVNLWAEGQNSTLGWGTTRSGRGVRSFGQMIAQTKEFPRCMAKRAYQLVCMKKPTESESGTIQELADGFAANGRYNMKNLIAEASIKCSGE